MRTPRHRPALADAINWIALNDESAETDPEVIAQSLTVMLVADVWKREPTDIARRVAAERRRWERDQ